MSSLHPPQRQAKLIEVGARSGGRGNEKKRMQRRMTYINQQVICVPWIANFYAMNVNNEENNDDDDDMNQPVARRHYNFYPSSAREDDSHLSFRSVDCARWAINGNTREWYGFAAARPQWMKGSREEKILLTVHVVAHYYS